MARALRLARRGLYTTHPNPRVGCVLVHDDIIVGEGFHRRAGEPHAERNALAMAGARARDATAYVTLEPCSHHGRTPPCADGLLEAGVRRVVVAMADPNPLVAGQGLETLRHVGVLVESGLLEPEARLLNAGFIKRMQRGRPLVRCKLAQSLDGRTAMASGESKWITGVAARRDVQRLRARSDAIVTGIGTVLADDPSMTVRLGVEELPGVESEAYLPSPLRVVLDPAGEMPAGTRMLRLPGDTLIFCSVATEERMDALRRAGAEVERLPGDDKRVELDAVFERLARREVNEVLLEAGPTLAGAALAGGQIDELLIYTAPLIMGSRARGLFNLPGLERMGDRIELEIEDMRMVGRDLRVTARPRV